MKKFWWALWRDWAFFSTIYSITWSLLVTSLLLVVLYLIKGASPLTLEVVVALGDIGIVSLQVIWSLVFPTVLIWSFKRIFNRTYAGYKLKLFSCKTEELIDEVLLEDVLKLWRRWLFSLFWVLAFFITTFLIIDTLFSGVSLHFNYWINGVSAWAVVLSAGGLFLKRVLLQVKNVQIGKTSQ